MVVQVDMMQVVVAVDKDTVNLANILQRVKVVMDQVEVPMAEMVVGIMEVLVTLIHSRMLITLKAVLVPRQAVIKQVTGAMAVDGLVVVAVAE